MEPYRIVVVCIFGAARSSPGYTLSPQMYTLAAQLDRPTTSMRREWMRKRGGETKKKHVYYIVILTDINNNKPNNWTADKIYVCCCGRAAVLFYFHRLVDASIRRVSRASAANLVKTKRLYISHSLIFHFLHSIISTIDDHRNDLSHLHFHWIISNVIVA